MYQELPYNGDMVGVHSKLTDFFQKAHHPLFTCLFDGLGTEAACAELGYCTVETMKRVRTYRISYVQHVRFVDKLKLIEFRNIGFPRSNVGRTPG